MYFVSLSQDVEAMIRYAVGEWVTDVQIEELLSLRYFD
jgi:hypothetical protein